MGHLTIFAHQNKCIFVTKIYHISLFTSALDKHQEKGVLLFKLFYLDLLLKCRQDCKSTGLKIQSISSSARKV